MSKGNINITGNGTIVAGEYTSIKVLGNAEIEGEVSAEQITIMGNANIKHNVDVGKMIIHGNATVEGTIRGEEIKILGNLKVNGSVEGGKLDVKGDCSIGRKANCEEVKIAGDLEVEESCVFHRLYLLGELSAKGDITGESIEIKGRIQCSGLLNAENITVYSYANSFCKEIGATNVKIMLPSVFARIFHFGADTFRGEVVEGDTLLLEKVSLQTVRGNSIAISKNSKVEQVEYVTDLQVSSNSTVGRTEKIGDE